MDGFQSLNSDFEFQSLGALRIADFKTRDSRFNKQNFPDFGFHKQSGIVIVNV